MTCRPWPTGASFWARWIWFRVCSPAVTHAAIVRAFLKAGAHVLVEKPIATTVAEADELVALARKTGLTLTVGHQERFVFARTGLLDQTVRRWKSNAGGAVPGPAAATMSAPCWI